MLHIRYAPHDTLRYALSVLFDRLKGMFFAWSCCYADACVSFNRAPSFEGRLRRIRHSVALLVPFYHCVKLQHIDPVVISGERAHPDAKAARRQRILAVTCTVLSFVLALHVPGYSAWALPHAVSTHGWRQQYPQCPGASSRLPDRDCPLISNASWHNVLKMRYM